MSSFSLDFSYSNFIYCKVIILVVDAHPLSFPINLKCPMGLVLSLGRSSSRQERKFLDPLLVEGVWEYCGALMMF
jgi:hypothetical protein